MPGHPVPPPHLWKGELLHHIKQYGSIGSLEEHLQAGSILSLNNNALTTSRRIMRRIDLPRMARSASKMGWSSKPTMTKVSTVEDMLYQGHLYKLIRCPIPLVPYRSFDPARCILVPDTEYADGSVSMLHMSVLLGKTLHEE